MTEHKPDPDEDLDIRANVERLIDRAMQLTNGNATKAAALLGVRRETVYRRLRRLEAEYGKNPPQVQEPDV